jgi:hypothetical protein
MWGSVLSDSRLLWFRKDCSRSACSRCSKWNKFRTDEASCSKLEQSSSPISYFFVEEEYSSAEVHLGYWLKKATFHPNCHY